MGKQPIWTGAVVADSPYTPGIKSGNLVFVSGQVPLDPATKKLVEGSFEDQVRRCILNVQAILESAGSDLSRVVKVTVFLKDLNDFGRLNAVYGEYWGDVKPARSCVEVARLPLDVPVEIEAIATTD